MSRPTQYSVNVEARGPSAAYALDISSDTRVESGLCAGSLKMELAADKTRNNADWNDQTSSTTRAVKNS